MASDELRQDMVDQVREEQQQQQRQRAPRVHKAPASRDAGSVVREATPAADADRTRPDSLPAFAPGEPATDVDAPKKRRRRRRSSGPREGGEPTSDAGV